MAGRPAVFLDRDGTLIEEAGYINHPGRVRLVPGAAAAVRRLNGAGVAAVVVTNQAAVARGFITEEVVAAAHRELEDQLAAAGAALDGIYTCLHHPTDGEPGPLRRACDCRKPAPGLLRAAADDHGLDLAASAVVGDLPSDLAAGAAVGATRVLVLTGYGRGEWEYHPERFPEPPDHVADDLAAAVDWLLARWAR